MLGSRLATTAVLASLLATGIAGAARPAGAQAYDLGGVPQSVAREIADVYNAPGTMRRTGQVTVRQGEIIDRDLAVRSGSVTIAGRVEGMVLAINADVIFRPGARVEGNVLVIGGRIEGRDDAIIEGDVRTYAETLRYRMRGDDIDIVEGTPATSERARSAPRSSGRSYTRGSTTLDMFNFASAGPYNRVEGLPIRVGPRLRLSRDWGTFTLETRGIIRTAEPHEWDSGTLGHDARVEARWGHDAGFGAGLTHFDRVDPVEDWHLTDSEVSLAAFAAHRDYRDYFGRHGGSAYLRAYVSDYAWMSLGIGEERWASRDARNPWSLFRDDEPWLPNPAVNEGKVRLVTAALQIDTRSPRRSLGSGWYVQADIERGDLDEELSLSDPATPTVIVPREYTRGFVDVRRYNRLAPGAQLNLRVVIGGWLDGDALPLQRRLSVGGPGTLPGFDYRRHRGGEDRLQCSTGTGSAAWVPALCDRIALAQVEYRGDLSWHANRDGENRWLPNELHLPTWVVFANAGRGWRAQASPGSGDAVESFPDLSTFKTDVGIGLDFGSLSLSAAKSMSDKDEDVNVVVRLSRRF